MFYNLLFRERMSYFTSGMLDGINFEQPESDVEEDSENYRDNHSTAHVVCFGSSISFQRENHQSG